MELLDLFDLLDLCSVPFRSETLGGNGGRFLVLSFFSLSFCSCLVYLGNGVMPTPNCIIRIVSLKINPGSLGSIGSHRAGISFFFT